ncbi:MAG: hypothetical protein COB32_13395 [Halomonas sp.]|nr:MULTISPECIES: type II toxin-antitoxin system CcdA family antitoxin [unclassified Halomonas]PHR00257.1 MAG: hypothetical protein COB32_13395 [Halomonas sp.]HBK37040.1 hypothetical protein [Halomonas sp.]HBQ07105.1 hypothetical protein [Halomonas sp.]
MSISGRLKRFCSYESGGVRGSSNYQQTKHNIAEAVKRHKQEKWLKENAKALASSNAYVEANGLPLARHRQF